MRISSRRQRPASADPPAPPGERAEETDPTATVLAQNVIHSQVLVGDGAVVLQIQRGSDTTLGRGGDPGALRLQELAPLRTPPGRSAPVGRGDVVALAAADLTAGRSVQLVGSDGVGRTTVATAVIASLAESDRRGAVLLGGKVPHTLDALYTRLAGLFFDTLWYRPDQDALRTQTARLAPTGLIVITDCDLTAAETADLLATFPRCTFLLTSTAPTLDAARRATVHTLDPLTLGHATEIVRVVLGRELRDAEPDQVGRAHDLAQGRARALVVAAAFLRRAADDPRRTDLVALGPVGQTALLVIGLDAPARAVLGALASFGPAPADLFPLLAVAGGPVLHAVPSVEDLVVPLDRAGLIEACDDGFAATPDAVGVMGTPISSDHPRALAEALITLAADSGGQSVVPSFALGVVQALSAAEDWALACRLARVAAQPAVGRGRVPTWAALIALGATAARAAGRREDLRYFLQQQHTEALLRNDAAAAIAVLLALTALLRTAPAPAPLVVHGYRPGPPRRLAGRGARAATAGHGAGGVVMAATAAAVVAAVVTALLQRPATAAVAKPAVGTAAILAVPVPDEIPQWHVTMSPKPLDPLPAADSGFSAQYPILTSGFGDAAQRAKIDAELQQPVRGAIVGDFDGTSEETTTVVQAGDLISVVYDFSDASSDFVTGKALAVVLRKDTGAVVPQGWLLTAQASLPAGADKISALVDAQDDLVGDTPFGCQVPVDGSLIGPAIAVTATGLTFYVTNDPGASEYLGTSCLGDVPATVPYSELVGLIEPAVRTLAEAGTPHSG